MTIILIAGMWLDSRAWQQVTPHLVASGHDVVALDLPGQGAEPADATLDDQAAAVVAAVDAATGPVVVVGHSAACSLAWQAADARPDKVTRVVMVGGFPVADGQVYFDPIEPVDGMVRFPGWDAFAGPDSDDLDDDARRLMDSHLVLVPTTVTHATVHLRDARRHDVPITLVCPEFSIADAKEWIASGDLVEFSAAKTLDFVDIDSGHWPMYSKPDEFAAAIDAIARAQ
ncbi:alpha/beta fold hydrolase [Propionibacteriaceae bacterium G1746]|uniref:alpha/beta fold hydrolase n=1 Tax=Aestuariimicrobium sp. G57 TaxID=3418485 RepID=UPI003C19C6E4